MEENQIIVDVGLDAFIQSLRHLQKQYELNTAALKAMKDAGEEQSDAYIMLTQEQKVLRQQMSSTEKAMQNEIKMQQAQDGSLVQLRAQLANLQKQYDNMSGMERMGEAGVALQKQIKSLHDEVLGLEGDTGRMQRNVGNYPAAVQPLREELEMLTKQLETLRSENKEGSDEFAAVEKRIGEVNQSITQLTGKVEGLATDTGNVRQQMRELTENLIAMKMRGEENTEQYRQMLEQLGKMKDAMQDTNAQVKQMASDTSTLNSVLTGAQAAAGGFSAALGIMNLVGAQDSETAKEMADAQRKLQAAIAITTGLQAVQNALQKESALMMGIHKLQIWAAAKAQDAYTAATGRATIAQRIFNAVAKSNPYVLLAAAILTVIGALVAFSAGQDEAKKQTSETNEEIEKQAGLLGNLAQYYDIVTSKMLKYYGAAIEKMKLEGKSLKEIREEEDKMMDYEDKRLKRLEDSFAHEIIVIDDMAKKIDQKTIELHDLQIEFDYELRQGHEEYAATLKNRYDALKSELDAEKELYQQTMEIINRRSEFENKRKKTEEERKKQDEENRKKAAEAAKQREEQLKREREEIKRNREELKKANEELLEYVDQLKEGLAPTGEGDFFDKLKEKYEAVDKAAREAQERHELLRRFILETKGMDIDAKLDDSFMEKLERESNPLYNFAQTYKENAQSIQETSSALQSSFQSLSSMYQQMANDESKTEEERAKAARKAKAWAAIQVASNAGAAIAKGVASAVDVGFPAAIPAIATMTATILAAIAQAKAMLSQMGGFETGGVIGGYRGATMGKDNTAISARTGEMILNAKQQRQLFEIANGGMSTNLTASLVEALQAMPAPVLVYSEFQRFTDRVATLDDAAKLQ